MIGIPYWDHRLHRWGAWLATGAGKLSSTPLGRLRELGVRVQDGSKAHETMVHDVERETDAMVRVLPGRGPQLLDAYYRSRLGLHQLAVSFGRHPDTLRADIRSAHKRLQRQLEERRSGPGTEQRSKAITVRAKNGSGRTRTVASVVPDR